MSKAELKGTPPPQEESATHIRPSIQSDTAAQTTETDNRNRQSSAQTITLFVHLYLRIQPRSCITISQIHRKLRVALREKTIGHRAVNVQKSHRKVLCKNKRNSTRAAAATKTKTAALFMSLATSSRTEASNDEVKSTKNETKLH